MIYLMRDEKGEIYTVRYEAVTRCCLNDFLKEHGTVEDQAVPIVELKNIRDHAGSARRPRFKDSRHE